MSLDISSIFKDWPYEPGQISARRIHGDDGRELIQLRLDLGILQMETKGRPDHLRPHGFESLLDYHRKRLQDAGEAEFELDTQECEQLRSEAMMFYHRYLAEFILEDYPAVVRDTERNLAAMDFCRDYAAAEPDRVALEQYRPYVIMMHSRAAGRQELRDNHPREALEAVQQGITDIENFYHRFGQDEMLEASGELAVLRAMAREIEPLIPADPAEQLRRQLQQAVEDERYEDAARLRDRLARFASGRRSPDHGRHD